MGLGSADAKVKASVQWEMDQDIDTEMKKVNKSVKKTDKAMGAMSRNTAKDMEKIRKTVKLGFDVFLAGELAGAIKAVVAGINQSAVELDKLSNGTNEGARNFLKMSRAWDGFKMGLADAILKLPLVASLITGLADIMSSSSKEVASFTAKLVGMSSGTVLIEVEKLEAVRKSQLDSIQGDRSTQGTILRQMVNQHKKLTQEQIDSLDTFHKARLESLLETLAKIQSATRKIQATRAAEMAFGGGDPTDVEFEVIGAPGEKTGPKTAAAKADNAGAKVANDNFIKDELKFWEDRKNEREKRHKEQLASVMGFGDMMGSALREQNELQAEAVEMLNDQALTSGVMAMTSAWSGFFEVLASGSGAFDQLAKAALSMLGDLAIQMGTYLFFAGIGLTLIPGFQASAGAIPAGLALMAAGGVMKGIAGRGGGASAPASSGSHSASGSYGAGYTPTAPRRDTGGGGDTNITISIGDTLDGAENIVRKLAGVMNKMGDSGHVRINRSVFQGG